MEEVVTIPPPQPLPSSPSTSLNQPLNPLAPPFSPNIPWSRALFKLPHIPSPQKLVFSPPLCKGDRVVALCAKDEVDIISEKWKDALQGFFADKRPFLPSVIAALKRKWEVKEALEVFPRPNGSLIFLFSSSEERKKVMESGPWFVMGRYLHIRLWSRMIRSRKDFFSFLPVWIHLPNLPLHLWSPGSIGKIAYVIGCPLYLDENSANSKKISYARVCIEISADKQPPSLVRVEVEDSDEFFDQSVEYETAFKICSECKSFGHLAENCAKVLTMKPTVRGQMKNSVLAKSSNFVSINQKDKSVVGQAMDRSWTKVHSKTKARKRIQITGVEGNSNAETHMNKKLVVSEHHPDNLVATKINLVKSNRFEPIAENSTENLILENPVNKQKNTGTMNGFSAGEDNDDYPALTEDEIPVAEDGTIPVAEGDLLCERLEDPSYRFDMSADNPFTASLNLQVAPKGPPKSVTGDRISGSESLLNLYDETEPIFKLHSEAGGDQSISNFNSIGTVVAENVETTFQVDHFEPVADKDGRLPFLPPNLGPNLALKTIPSTQAHYTLDSSHPTNPSPTQALILSSQDHNSLESTCPTLLNPSIQAQQTTNFLLDLPSLEAMTGDFDDETKFSIPPGFTPGKEDMNDLRDFMKEGVTLVPPEHQKEFLASVDLAEDGEILEFFQQKVKEKSKAIEDTNYLTYRNVRCSPRLKRKPAKFMDSPSSSGLKRGFIK